MDLWSSDRKREQAGNAVLPLPPAAANGRPLVILRSLRDAPPAHFRFRIENFSFLSSLKIEKYESGVFKAGSYKWKLCLYPNGNKEGQGEGHVSLYLAIADTKALHIGWEVNVNFKLFIYDHIRDKYLTFQDGMVRRFSKMRTVWGFDQFVSKEYFNDPSNGYIFHDFSCVFGAEVFVIKSDGRKDECLSMIKDPDNRTFTWKIVNFSVTNEGYLKSDGFVVAGWKWRLKMYPKGRKEAKGLAVSLFLMLDSTLPSERKLYAKYKLRIRDQVHRKHQEFEGQGAFDNQCGYGAREFVKLTDLKDRSKGLKINDKVIVQAEILALSVFKDF